MAPYRRMFLLIAIMFTIVIVTCTVIIAILYNTAIDEQRERLRVAVKSQARLIESIVGFARENNDDASNIWETTLAQIRDAHSKYQGFGKTGEFTLSVKENDQIKFLISHRHYDLNNPKPVPWNSKLAQPMRLALSGNSGTVIALDYRGEKVLAAHEPLSELNLGIVAKIDLTEIRAPFIKATIIGGLIAFCIIIVGAIVFYKITSPIIKRLSITVDDLQKALDEVTTLRGILPICSSCKKIRDDKGYWNQIEEYFRSHSDVEFSHSFCPECVKNYIRI